MRAAVLITPVLRLLGLLTIPLAAAGLAAASQNGPGTAAAPHPVPMTALPPTIDGSLDDPAWQNALRLQLNYEVRPGENIPPPVRTEVFLTHDARRLFVAFRCEDPEPAAIRAHLSDRDHLGSDDWVGVVLDTFNDQRRSFDLLANPLGVQEEFIQLESSYDSWDAIWESAGRISDWGYAVEMEIPFDQLRFQRTDGPQVWGFDAVRRYPRRLRHHIGLFPRERGNNCHLCQALKIEGFAGAVPGRQVEITPTLTAVRTDARPDFPAGDFAVENEDVEFGVTAKWGATPNLTFSGTANPDFSQVEADAMQLDVNEPFALYYSERRPFFTEGADFFRTLKTAVYTRVMRDPVWGAKLTGKEGRHTIGAYVVRDELTNLLFPGSQGSDATTLGRESTAGVLRYKRDVGSRYTFGVLATDREGGDYASRLVGFDTDLRLTSSDQIQVQLLGSRTEYPAEVAEEFDQVGGAADGRFLAFEYDHYTRRFGWWLDYDDVDRDFRADLGFIPRVDFRNVEGGLLRFWNAPPGAWWSDLTAACEVNYYEDGEGVPLQRQGSLWLSYEGARESWVYLRGYRSRETYDEEEFDLTSFTAQAGLRASEDLSVGLVTRFGDRIDYANTRAGTRVLLNPFAECQWGRHLRLELDHVFERMKVDGGRLYTANISRLSSIYQFSLRSFFRAIVQYVDYRHNVDLYVDAIEPEQRHLFMQYLFSYKINPLTVLFLGYGDNREGGEDYSLKQQDRTFFVKLGYAWLP